MTLTPHVHRCNGCRDPMPVACTERLCDEGMRWVVLCLSCYERLLAAAKAAWW